VGPLLRPGSGLTVPLPAIAGFNWSWITEQEREAGPAWAVEPELRPPAAGAVWEYSPQGVTEGWLRLNPELLQFRLTNSSGAPTVTAGTTTSLRLSITNARRVPITFTPASLAEESAPKQGSVFYIHFGALVPAAQVGTLQITAAGWQFELLHDTQYGAYWAASPAGVPVTLAPGASIQIALDGVQIGATVKTQARVYFDYYDVLGDDDGIDIAILNVIQSAAVQAA
jgi:hypothetical protein